MTCRLCKLAMVTRSGGKRGVLHACPVCDLGAAMDVITHPSNNRPRGDRT